jgi:hypothetical protein
VDSTSLALNTISSGLSSLVAIGGEIAIVVVVATVVKRHRPDAYGKLLAWAIASLVVTLALSAAYPLMPLFVRSGETDAYLVALSMIAFARTAANIALVLLLVRGLVALAQPPRPVVVHSDAPYR